MERLFQSFHETELKAGVNGVAKLIDIFKEVSINVPYEVMQFFIRCGMHFRIRILNSQRKSKYINKGVNKIKKKRLFSKRQVLAISLF